jgi:hypothetical protein
MSPLLAAATKLDHSEFFIKVLRKFRTKVVDVRNDVCLAAIERVLPNHGQSV